METASVDATQALTGHLRGHTEQVTERFEGHVSQSDQSMGSMGAWETMWPDKVSSILDRAAWYTPYRFWVLRMEAEEAQ